MYMVLIITLINTEVSCGFSDKVLIRAYLKFPLVDRG